MIPPTATARELHRLVAEGYIQPATGQAAVWHDDLNEAAPWATTQDLHDAVSKIIRTPHRWIAIGDVIEELYRIRSDQIEAETRRRRTLEVPTITRTPPERIRQILRAHGVDRPEREAS